MKKLIKSLCFLFICFVPLILGGCAESCNWEYSSPDYGAYKIDFYVDGEFYTSAYSNDDGYIPYGNRPNVPDKDGYRLDYWYNNPEYEGSTFSMANYRFTAERKFYARYIKTQKVTIINNVVDEEDRVTELEWDYGTNLFFNLDGSTAFDKYVSGYGFGGFYLDEACTQKVPEDKILDADYTIYLKHSLATYTISYSYGKYQSEFNNGNFKNNNIVKYTIEDIGYDFIAPETDYGVHFDYWLNTRTGSKIMAITGQLYYHDLELKAVWKASDVRYQRPAVAEDLRIEFGWYPQTLKADDVTIDESKTDRNGYFSGSDGNWYAKQKAKLWNEDKITLSDGRVLNHNEEYYFKVESIKWNSYSIDDKIYDDKHYILSQKILDVARNWYSDCNVLLEDFKENNFSDEQKVLIEKVDGGPWLFSRKNFGYYEQQTHKLATDYAIARGLKVYDSNCYGCWWLHEQDKSSWLQKDYYQYHIVDYDGYLLENQDKDTDFIGFVPYVCIDNERKD